MKRFKPYIILGLGLIMVVVFLMIEEYRIDEIVNTSSSSSLVVEKDSIEKRNIKIKITKDLNYFVDDKRINFEDLESELLTLEEAINESELKFTIVLSAEKSVPVQNIVNVMDIANRNKFKVILAVQQN